MCLLSSRTSKEANVPLAERTRERTLEDVVTEERSQERTYKSL